MIYQQHGESFFLLPFQQQNQPLKKKKKTYIDFWYHKVKSKKFIEKIVIEKY